jgi:hypothetical protein
MALPSYNFTQRLKNCRGMLKILHFSDGLVNGAVYICWVVIRGIYGDNP